MDTKRPSPDAVLKNVQDEESRKSRAKLKIFFGMAPGVGKTYAMLQSAQDRLDEGLDVMIGVVETHGRPETAALLAGLKTLPKRTLPYRGIMVEEFDLQQAIARKPQLILMDELAHTNAPGSIHAKRWQDVWDLLDAGINIYTTLNVQHIESLKDVVAHITGILVRETVPDTILSRADEIELVDLPPEDLVQRLKEGKVYIPEQARHAIDRFFRKGNLLALRELALRRTADHVDDDMRRYMSTEHIEKTWATNERLLVCISPSENSANLIRATQRLAERIKAPWIVAFVETRKIKHSEKDRRLVEEHLRLAERLGGETVVVQGEVSLAEDLASLAVTRNVTRILVGKPRGSRLIRAIWPSLVDRLVNLSESIDIMVIAREPDQAASSVPRSSAPASKSLHFFRHSALTLLSLVLATVIALFMKAKGFELADIAMLYVLDILVIGYRFGLRFAGAASVIIAFTMDYFFVPPFHTFGFSDTKHIGTFLTLLTVGVVIGNMAERIRAQVRLASEREHRTHAIFKLAAEFAHGGTSQAIIDIASQSIASQFQCDVGLLLPDAEDRLVVKNEVKLSSEEKSAAQWTYDHGEASGKGTDTLPDVNALLLPLQSARGNTQSTIGVLAIKPMEEGMEPDKRHLLEAITNQTALALERALLSEKSLATQRQIDQEQLRSALLSSVSQDLQSPLANIINASSKMKEFQDNLDREEQRLLLETVHTQTQHLQRLLLNLMDIAKLESGIMDLDRNWIPAGDLIHRALRKAAQTIGDRQVLVELPDKLPSAWVDQSLAEQLLVNLLENAAKFSPRNQPMEIRAWSTDKTLTFAVRDHGPGLPEGLEERIFEKLVRAETPYGKAGAGLGLAICKGIAEAHGGWIQGNNHPSGGAQFLVSLPLGPPRAIKSEEL